MNPLDGRLFGEMSRRDDWKSELEYQEEAPLGAMP